MTASPHSWALAWHPQAIRDLRRFSVENQRRVRTSIERLATNDQGDVIRLQGIEPPRYRLRVGEVRVLFAFESETRTLRVLRILPRGRAYRD